MIELLSPARRTSTVRRATPPFSYTAPVAPLAGAVLLVTPWYGGSEGGVAVVTETLVGALTRAHVRVVVLALGTSTGTREQPGSHGESLSTICLYGHDVRRRGARAALGYYRRVLQGDRFVRQLVRRHDIRVAHLHFGVPEYAPLLKSLNRLKVPSVLTFHGSDAHQLDVTTPAAIDMNAVVAAATTITAISEGLLATAVERLPAARGKSQAVSNSAPLDLWDSTRTAPLPELRSTDVLFVGNLRAVKGPDFLLEAFARVVQHRHDATLSIVGSGEMEPQLREMTARLGVESNVRFHGRASREEMSAHFRGARVLAVPSRAEGLSIAAIEAQLHGMPVVATNVGGIPEAVLHERTGTLVPFGDADRFARALLALLDDDAAWAKASAQAREWATRSFDPAAIAARYVALYRHVASTARVATSDVGTPTSREG